MPQRLHGNRGFGQSMQRWTAATSCIPGEKASTVPAICTFGKTTRMNERLGAVAGSHIGTHEADLAIAGDPGALEACLAAFAGHGLALDSLLADAGPGGVALADAYRTRGFLKARLDPLGLSEPPDVAELDPALYGLKTDAASRLATALEAAYCGPIGWEICHVHDRECRLWLQAQAEDMGAHLPTDADRERILDILIAASAFETGLSSRIPGGKLFGLGGAESFNVLLETLLAHSAAHGIASVVIGGMHRGRFNLLANICGKPLPTLVAEILGAPAVPSGLGVSSDVSYHLGYSGTRTIDGHALKFTVLAHPSHLQIVPVMAQGQVRARQARRGESGKRMVLPLLLHTDASFAGQGLVAEMFQLSRLTPYDIGGTVHIVINNQIGFTTNPEEGRTARAPTDIARLVEAPVLHVNGDDPEAVFRAGRVAADWRARFRRDIVLDLVCYRRPGHNEIDEPTFTQPVMYKAIAERPPVHEIYAETLRGIGLGASAQDTQARAAAAMADAFAAAKSYSVNAADRFEGSWQGLRSGSLPDMLAGTATGLPLDRLKELGRQITTSPAGFNVAPKVQRFLDERWASIESGHNINWATGEALALASLLGEGVPVRFSGQDCVRGAFTQRHLELHDAVTGSRHLTLSSAAAISGLAEVFNTPLIEHAVLTFEYGMSLADPRRLVVWEAQFGEFLNIAQPVFDQCISCGEDRWLRSSGLVILLPHGIDGGGPDHSTGRPERLLAACAGANITVANVSTPANFFHILRRQMARDFRKPLVVLTPKALLRNKGCVSTLADFGPGTGFRSFIHDTATARPRRAIFCSGKIYYELVAARAARGLEEQVALHRVEQLYPLPDEAIRYAVIAHPDAELVWCEEEPENMGAFCRLDRWLEACAGRAFRRIGRPRVATPAVGVKYWHEAEIKAVLDQALS